MKTITKLSAKPKETSEPRDCITHTRYAADVNTATHRIRLTPRVFQSSTKATIAGTAASRDIPDARTIAIPATVGIRPITP